VLDLVLARHHQRQDLEIGGRLRPAHTLDRFRAALAKVSQQRSNELAIQLLAVTRADRPAGKAVRALSRNRSLPRRHDAVAIRKRQPHEQGGRDFLRERLVLNDAG